MPEKLPISLCTFVKNEEDNLRGCIESVLPVVSEIIVVDTGSSDRTVEIAKEYTQRVYSVGFTDFGSIRTLTAHLANMPWVLMLDADERLSPDWNKLKELVMQPYAVNAPVYDRTADNEVMIDSWALPRKRWADKWMTIQEDVESFPDWQIRLFRNHTVRRKIEYVRRVHETAKYCVRTEHSIEGPFIHHFQNVHKDKNDLKVRENLYKTFYDNDISDGIKHTAPPVIKKDSS
jgi:glycosyltransferase involved in cell wall biosynthesis